MFACEPIPVKGSHRFLVEPWIKMWSDFPAVQVRERLHLDFQANAGLGAENSFLPRNRRAAIRQ